MTERAQWATTSLQTCKHCGHEYRRDKWGRRERDLIVSESYCSVTCNLEARGRRRYGEPPMDSWKTPISDEVTALCNDRFTLDGSGCTQCPLRQACHSGPTANLTFERMEEWRLRLNAAAASLTKGQGAA